MASSFFLLALLGTLSVPWCTGKSIPVEQLQELLDLISSDEMLHYLPTEGIPTEREWGTNVAKRSFPRLGVTFQQQAVDQQPNSRIISGVPKQRLSSPADRLWAHRNFYMG
ncbi:uncharacterized protein LOC144753278 isoform X2 [Lissotriton helveticus]